MFSKIGLAAWAALWLCASACLAAPPLEAYGRLPNLEQMELSPDGSAVAFVQNVQDKHFVGIQRLGSNQPPTVLALGTRKLRWLQWGSHDHLIITSSETSVPRGMDGEKTENFLAQAYDLKTGKVYSTLDHAKGMRRSFGAMNVVVGRPKPRIIDGKPVVFLAGIYWPDVRPEAGPATWDLQDTYSQLGLFRFDFETGEARLVSREGRKDISDWVIDAAGHIVAEEDYTLFTQHWKLVLYSDGKPDKTVMDIPALIDRPHVVGLTEDEAAIVVEMPQTAEGNVYKQISLKDGSIAPWRPDLANAGTLWADDRTGQVVGVARAGSRSDYDFFNPSLDAMWKSIKSAFASASEVNLVSYSQDKTQAVIEVFGANLGNGYFFLDRAAKKAYPIAPTYDGINEFYEKKWISYKSADGNDVPAYLTLPKREAKSLPLIVLPHGGPHSRDMPGFDWWAQALASRGYVVLQPQFRGSEGFGRPWLEAGFHEFGKKMQTDLSDGVRALAAQGLIDPKRVCIMGGSYGGYAALAGATLDIGVYRCAVSVAGDSDLRQMLKGWPKTTMSAAESRFWDRFIGTENGNLSNADVVSPAKLASRVSIPILLIHGKDDTIVRIEQSEIMADALKSAGKSFEFIKLDGEDHYLSKSDTRLRMLQETVRFIEANNPPN